MMPFASISKRVFFQRICPLCTIMAWAILSLLPVAAAAQAVVGDPPALAPGQHYLTLSRGDEPAIRYTISIPANHSPATPVPLILALHFGVGGGDAAGAGGEIVQILIGPALAELGAIIVAPDSVRGNWSTPENEKAVNALLDMVLAHYAIDKNKIAVTGYSMGGAGSWHFAEKFPERFSAAIPVAGRPPASASGWRLPVLAIHSRDRHAPNGSGLWPGPMTSFAHAGRPRRLTAWAKSRAVSAMSSAAAGDFAHSTTLP
jgi:poly(3-hydroxybutyrate) depolymerase